MPATITQNSKPLHPRALDTSGNNNHGTAYTGQALEFDGVGDYITMPLTFMNGATAVSISLWFNTTESNSGMIAKYASSSMYAWWINVQGGKLTANINANRTATSDLTSTSDVNDGNWHYATLTWSYSSGLASLYLDGLLIDTDANTNETDLRNGSLNNTIGFQGYISGGNLFEQGAGLHQGLLSNVQIWDTVLTASDVAYAYANPEALALDTPSTSLTYSNLKLWYPMQGGHRGQQSYLLDGANTGKHTLATLASASASNLSNYIYALDGNGNNVPKVSGQAYKYTWTIDSHTSGGGVKVHPETTDIGYVTSVETHTTTFVATGTTSHKLYANAWTGTISKFTVEAVNLKSHGTSTFYGDELITNGTMEADSNWADRNIGEGESNTRSTEQANNGTYSRKIVATANDSGCKSDNFSVVAGRAYLVECYVYVVSGTCRIQRAAGYVDVTVSSTGTGSWEKLSGLATSTATNDESFKIVADGGASTFYVDDVSVKEIGFATGWTDADAQTAIPQLGFQSYNQLGMFNGVDTSVTLDSNVTLAHDGMTFSCWLYRNEVDAHHSIFGNATNNAQGLYISSSDNCLRLKEDGSSLMTSTNALSAGKWYHIVVTHAADNDGKFYIDGVKEDPSTDAINADIILREFGTRGDNDLYLNGSLTECSAWNVSMTDAQVEELYNDGEALDALTHSSKTNLVGYWRNRGAGTWTDLSIDGAGASNGNHGTPTNVSEYLILPEGNNGRDTQGFLMTRNRVGLNLSGVGNYIKVPINHTFGTNDFSYGFWFKIQDGQGMYMTGVQTLGNAGGVGLTMDAGNGKIRSRPFGVTAVYTSAAYDDNEWHYAHHNIDRSANAILYIDGDTAVLTQDISSDSGDSLSTDSWHIGAENGTGNYFDGMIDDLNVYSSLLTTDQIARNYKAGKRRHRS